MPSRREWSRVLLVTGMPGTGKSTVLRRVAEGLRGERARGFLTGEIRDQGRRVGFKLETLGGRASTLAHIRIRSAHRVGRYGVDVPAFEEAVRSALRLKEPPGVYLIDEIGKMECFSTRFVEAMEALLESGHRVVATVALRGGGFIERVKKREDATLIRVTRENRDSLPDEILAWIREGRE